MVFRLAKMLTVVFLFVVMLGVFIPIKAQAYNQLALSAEGALLMDVESGRILYAKKPEQKMRIASLTKIMTAIVAIEYGDLNEIVTTSDRAFGKEGSSIYLRRGEKLSLENMLYGLMLRSGNDAAVAIAEHIGGSVEGFAYLMNEKAAYIGMNNSHFMNPHGLDQAGHYSTAMDMALLARYSLKNHIFKEIVSTKIKTAPLEGEPWDRKWVNKNKLLSMYKGADGVKTGYTKLARRCLVSSASKDGRQLVAVTLNAPDDWNDHIKMFEYGFQNYQPYKIIVQGADLGKIKLNNKEEAEFVAENDFIYLLAEEEMGDISKKIKINKKVKKINSGQSLGRIEIYFKGEFIGSVPIKIKDKTVFSGDIWRSWSSILKGE